MPAIRTSFLFRYTRSFAFRSLLLLTAAFCCVSVWADVTKRGEKTKKNDTALNVPEVRDVSNQFIAGESVEVELSAAVGSLKGVTFFIRQYPQHGTLSEIRPHPQDNNKALVTYTHLDRNAQLTDVFTYACRIEGGSFSAPATVTLTGKKFDPVLEITRQPQFGRIFVGGDATSKVEVKNTGAATYKQPLAWEPPWEGPPELEVLPGKTTEFFVGFRPQKSGNFRLEVPLQPEVTTSFISLFGEAIPALTASPSRLVLTWDPKTKERSAILTLANSKVDRVDATFELPERLLGPKTLSINPQSKAEIRFFLAPSDVAAFKEQMTVSAGGVQETVSVEAVAQPAEIKLVSPEQPVIDFRVIDRHQKSTQDFIVVNSGGQDLLANILARPPFHVQEAGQVIRLQPGQQRRFVMDIDTKNAGTFETTMDISGASQKVTVKLVAEVREVEKPPTMAVSESPKPTPSPSVPAPSEKPKAEPPATNPVQSAVTSPAPVVTQSSQPTTESTTNGTEEIPSGLDEMTIPRPKVLTQSDLDRERALGVLAASLSSQGLGRNMQANVNPHLDPPVSIEAKDTTSTETTLLWSKTLVPPSGWTVETSKEIQDPASGLIMKLWIPVPVAEAKGPDSNSEFWMAKLRPLAPNTQYEFRVLGIDGEGKMSRPSPSVNIITPPSWRVPTWIWRVLIVGALGLVFYILYRVRRGDFEFEV